MNSTVYTLLEQRFTRLSRLNHLSSMAKWDEAVNMPAGGGLARARALTEISNIQKELLHDAKVQQQFNAVESEALNDWQQANVREMQRIWKVAVAVPIKLSEKLSMATLETEQRWRLLRKENNWRDFEPLLAKVVELTREQANYLAELFDCNPYEALMQLYQTDFSQGDIDVYFDRLQQELPTLLQAIQHKQQATKMIPLTGHFDTQKQRQLCELLMLQMGFDFNHGRLDVTHHPFCGGVPEDTRINTRFLLHDFTECLMATIHETGHGCYEQGLPAAWLEQPVGQSRGMAIHESQSLLYEMQLGRSEAFLRYLQPILKDTFAKDCEYSEALSWDNLLCRYQTVEPGLIRTSADEVTYPLHIILRYQIERDLMNGEMQVADIPERWDSAMQNYLGLSTKDNYRDGCMQDVHWAGGAFGYFPFYTLGAMLAAQLMATIRADCDDLDSALMAGDVVMVSDWLRNNIWQQGRYYTSKDLVKRACGGELTVVSYLNHLQERYL